MSTDLIFQPGDDAATKRAARRDQAMGELAGACSRLAAELATVDDPVSRSALAELAPELLARLEVAEQSLHDVLAVFTTGCASIGDLRFVISYWSAAVTAAAEFLEKTANGRN